MINVDHITVNVPNATLLKDVSFGAAPGEMIGLLGPNGAGKSTCLKAIAGLQAISSGSITIDDHELASLAIAERATKIGYLPQDRSVYWPVPARRIVELGLYAFHKVGAQKAAAGKLVDDAIAEVGAAAFANRTIDQLSGGEKARIHLARTLVGKPPVILCDEPTTALDPKYQLSVMQVLRRRAENGAIVVVALHDLTLAAQFCTRIILLDDGAVAADGAPSAVLNAQNVRTVFGVEIRNPDAARFATPDDKPN